MFELSKDILLVKLLTEHFNAQSVQLKEVIHNSSNGNFDITRSLDLSVQLTSKAILQWSLVPNRINPCELRIVWNNNERDIYKICNFHYLYAQLINSFLDRSQYKLEEKFKLTNYASENNVAEFELSEYETINIDDCRKHSEYKGMKQSLFDPMENTEIDLKAKKVLTDFINDNLKKNTIMEIL